MSANLPAVGARVQVVVDGDAHPCHVEAAAGARLSVNAPIGLAAARLPAPGATVHLRWTDRRGRHHVGARLAGRDAQTWELDVVGDVAVNQQRLYVRGGGGEPMRLRRLDPAGPALDGEVVDVAERGLRGRFAHVDLEAGDRVTVAVTLDGEPVTVLGTVLRVIELRELRGLEVVVTFEPSETQATLIRRYVLAAQLRARQLAAAEGRAGHR
ncbi:hypothetical protein GCM10010124_04040 [Pilimelia terevasa]|uniref:PilZ domain-containing protein n=1 Tax=Pilimelia terevasa TaxID=53372 RepID=A0A8J3BJ22_9ACTN|nr:PilZ domain-containing protein [Pilimelia terevasa]GGK14667.1 hypothetical protein GCM10010124_04040 [Pilimelia terevasa]